MVINPSLLPPLPHDPWAPNLATSKAEARVGEDAGIQAALAAPVLADPLIPQPAAGGQYWAGLSGDHASHCEAGSWPLTSWRLLLLSNLGPCCCSLAREEMAFLEAP